MFYNKTKSSLLVTIIYSVAMIALGIFVITHPETLISIIIRIIGLCALAIGVSTLIHYFVKGKTLGESPLNILTGSIMTLAGLVFLFYPLKLTSLVFVVIGIMVISKGIFELRAAWTAHIVGFFRWNGMMISGVITTLLGILMIANPLIAPSIIFYVMGAAIIFEGVATLVSSLLCREYYNEVESN